MEKTLHLIRQLINVEWWEFTQCRQAILNFHTILPKMDQILLVASSARVDETCDTVYHTGQCDSLCDQRLEHACLQHPAT